MCQSIGPSLPPFFYCICEQENRSVSDVHMFKWGGTLAQITSVNSSSIILCSNCVGSCIAPGMHEGEGVSNLCTKCETFLVKFPSNGFYHIWKAYGLKP